ncbi:uncharacterized protein LOC100839489 [Brachypodium distachyon]|uniref:UvrD-like helicase ATP-binding domain-containing protein n=1 Tax=Brachypodium distachyon TaxID=15368 RepID=A0A2K2CIA9_BRADI|nr:uncharacterized protein LOC100839489 [Brachypodium distachyon]PNT61766.1 hypothetical protein BRADI_5g20420v3 [Brachypodium distachyon]|eukprot:XP_024311276.1 uncharacterized protein LOC100839489 [Brachypodium distachyon]
MGEMDLGDMVLSWSLQEIMDDDLYRGKVETIPCNFNSLDQYLNSYRAPLIEETRSDLCSCLELISEAPSSKILSMEVAGKSGLYFMDVDFWDNGAGFSTETYTARNGDIFILSSMKPEAAEDFNRYGVTYSLAIVTEVSLDDEYQKGFRVKVAKDIGLEEDLNKLRHAIFLNNIMTNIRIWKALSFDTHMDNNFTVIKSLLAPTNLSDDICGICVKHDGDCLTSFTEQLLSINLNRSQVDAIESVISAIRCRHMDHTKLIWGPPGTGKTKTVSALLWVLACLKCRTLTCAPTNVAVVGVCARFLQNLKDFNEHIDESSQPFPLGDVLLFGNKSNMDITEDLEDVFLDFRVDVLVESFSLLSGWKYRIASVISLFEDCASQYDMLLEDDGKSDPVCLLDFIKKQFDVTSLALKRCIMNLWIHLPGRCFPRDKVSKLLNMLEKFGVLLCDADLTDESLKRGLGCLSTENSVCVQPMSFIEKELGGARFTCLKLLKDLQHSLNLPTGVDKMWVQSYCMRNATLLFCTTSSSYRLHHMEIAPLDVLIVDEAAQVRECELVIPLRLHWLKHVVLVGDDCQLSAMVKSQVCKEAGFGTSLFGRLVLLNFEKYLLNIQYRMHPCISSFPNAQFYERKILDGSNVLFPSYNEDYTCLPFGSYTFINVTDGREDKEGTGNSRRNMVEVVVVLHLIQTIFKSRKRTGQGLSIGVVSPYSSQVDAIKRRLDKTYDKCDGFHVRVKSIDGFQGEEDDIIILSTVRSNGSGVVGFLADYQRTNVALTRARHCLWIVGHAHTLYKSGTVWTDLVADAQRRKCVFSATDDSAMCKLVLKVKQELDELDDLLNADSVVFSNTRWKVVVSDEFRKSFTKIKSPHLRGEVLQKLIKLGGGWRIKVKNLDIPGGFHLAKVYKVRDLYLVWSTDLEKNETRYRQIIRIWDLLSQQHVARTVQRLENLFSMYTDDYLDHCRRVQTQGKLEVPMVWDVEHDIIRYKKDCKADAQEEQDLVDRSYAMENSKVSECFLLMKFYSLSSGVAKHLLTATDGSEIDIPFELTDEEEVIIQFPLTSFILGRSGTGKTTVLTMKLIQKEQQSLIASQGLNLDAISGANDKNIMPVKDVGESSVKQVFITVSPKLCSAIKNHICRLKRFSSGDVSDDTSILHMHDSIDDLEEFTEIPDNFSDLPHEHYPLTITYRKFLMMLDGTCKTSFFDVFYGEVRSSNDREHSKSRAWQTFIESKEVTYEKFASFYWPRCNADLTKKFDSSTVFTEIISHIKGGYQASRPYTGKLGRQDYVMLSDKRFSSLNSEKRDKIYDIFLDYETMKSTAREFDLSDFVNSLHSSLVSEGYNGDMVDFVYIDEVQDLTMTQIALLKYVCRNFKEGFVFAGDTAQTIARGIDFRFEDIRSLFYTGFLKETEAFNQGVKKGKKVHLSDMFQLSQNFRTHCGILRMAQSIMSLLYFFFPSSVDKLNPETGLVYGEAPVLLESDNDENAIMTIFGESKSKHGNLHGFGAEQVILVRDDATKKQVVDLVGKQALVLTIVECKGLEFQDVLLYNFFGSSPLRNKWRVLYGYMKDRNIIAQSEEVSHPDFDRSKHYLLCSELKQLYVAITRTRQRLWICENTDDHCRPMFDYWKKLCLVEVRLLDSSLVQAMQTGSSTDDWRLRGTKLFNEGQFKMATMCFEKAGDAHREKWARAAGLVATADRVISTNLELGKASYQTASEIYESIGMHEKAAACYMKLGDYKRAGMVYMQKCGSSRLEDAGDCFAVTECWSEAAEVYFKAKCYTKCFSMCSKGKQLFHLGLRFLQQLEEEHLIENSKSLEVSAIRKTYLENCAQHYFERGDIKLMIPFVKAFSSMDHVRAFLNSRNLVDELLSLEMEMGNFLEAAAIAKHKGNVLLEVDMLEKANLFENATHLLLLHIVVDSLWSSNSRGWPPKRYAEKEQLLAKAKEMAKNVSEFFYCFACLETDAMSDVHKSLPSLNTTLLESRKCGNLFVELVASRSILDVHLQSRASGYNLELGPGSEDESSCSGMLACNQISPQTLVYFWNHWKSIIVKVLCHLRHSDGLESNDYAIMYEDLCAKYFGWRKDDEDDRYVVLNMNSSWLSITGRNSLQQDGNRCWLDVLQCHSCALHFCMNELSSVGLSVLKKLESFVQVPPKQASSYALVRTVLMINEIAKFLEEPEFSMPKSTIKLKSFFALCERRFFELVFLLWRDGTARSLLCVLDSPTAYGLIADSLGAYLRPTNKNLTHGHLGRTTLLLLHAARLDDVLISRLQQYLDNNSEWTDFFRCLKRFLDTGVDRTSLISNFKLALDFTFNEVEWRDELDYISPICYVGLIECLAFLSSAYLIQNDCIFCTSSVLVNMLECRTSKVYLDTCLVSNSSPDSDMDHIARSTGRFISQTIMTILTNKNMLREWARMTSTPTSSYIPVLQKLVLTLYPLILTLSVDNCYEVTNSLLKCGVFEDLPLEFSQKIVHALQMRSRTPSNFTRVFADALAAIGNRMVVIGSPKGRGISGNLNAHMISTADLCDVQKVMALLRPEELSSVKQKTLLPEEIKSNGKKVSNILSGNFLKTSNVRDNKMESTKEMDLSDESIPFWERFEAFQVNKQGQQDARVISRFLVSAISWLEQRIPTENVDVQLFEEVKQICDEFAKNCARAKKRVTVEDLLLRWEDGESKLQTFISLLRSQKASMEGDRRNEAAAAVEAHSADQQTGCSDNEPDAGGSNEVESVEEEAAAPASTSKKAAQKQKNMKKSKKSKGRGRK